MFPIVLDLKVSQDPWPFLLTMTNVASYFAYNVMVCYCFSFLLYVFVEAPAYSCLKYFYGEKKWVGKQKLDVAIGKDIGLEQLLMRAKQI